MFFLYTITIIIVDLSQVTFIYIVLFTIHIVSKQQQENNAKKSLFREENSITVQLKFSDV